MSRYSYGAKPKPYDELDRKYARVTAPHAIPTTGAVLRPEDWIFDQADQGSCVPNSILEVVNHLVPGFIGSRSFLYRETRLAQHDLHSDDGCDPRTALNALRKHGAPPESEWAYTGQQFDKDPMFAKTPTRKVYKDAHKLVDVAYENLGQVGGILNDVRDCIGNRKLPCIFSMAVFSSFESDEVARTGKFPVPNSRTDQMVGWHEMSFWEYDDRARLIKTLNHWGAGWGDGGWCYTPYEVAANMQLVPDATVVTQARLLA